MIDDKAEAMRQMAIGDAAPKRDRAVELAEALIKNPWIDRMVHASMKLLLEKWEKEDRSRG